MRPGPRRRTSRPRSPRSAIDRPRSARCQKYRSGRCVSRRKTATRVPAEFGIEGHARPLLTAAGGIGFDRRRIIETAREAYRRETGHECARRRRDRNLSVFHPKHPVWLSTASHDLQFNTINQAFILLNCPLLPSAISFVGMRPKTPLWTSRFFETTRGQIVLLLRQEVRTVAELAEALELTDNAARASRHARA